MIFSIAVFAECYARDSLHVKCRKSDVPQEPEPRRTRRTRRKREISNQRLRRSAIVPD